MSPSFGLGEMRTWNNATKGYAVQRVEGYAVQNFENLLGKKMRNPLCACGQPKRKNNHDCLACHAAYMRAHRPKHSELSDEQRTKANARSYANVYQHRGKLLPQPCEVCASPLVQKHHDDYGKPLQVAWLCVKDHRAEHSLGA